MKPPHANAEMKRPKTVLTVRERLSRIRHQARSAVWLRWRSRAR